MLKVTPAWILPVFPVMLSGTVASVIAKYQPSYHAIPILIAGTTFQGLGILISIFMYSNYIGRLMSNGLPNPDTRPGMFISVGPPAFTGLAFIGMANAAIDLAAAAERTLLETGRVGADRAGTEDCSCLRGDYSLVRFALLLLHIITRDTHWGEKAEFPSRK